jgi:hypothetical protein
MKPITNPLNVWELESFDNTMILHRVAPTITGKILETLREENKQLKDKVNYFHRTFEKDGSGCLDKIIDQAKQLQNLESQNIKLKSENRSLKEAIHALKTLSNNERTTREC